MVIGKNHKGALVTANDRVTGMAKIKKIQGKDSVIVQEAIIEMLDEFRPILKTITSDNGKEFSQHQEIARELDVGYYFARPYGGLALLDNFHYVCRSCAAILY